MVGVVRQNLKFIKRAEVVRALAHPARLQMIDALGDGEMCVQELTTLVGLDMSTVSKHLSVMKSAGLLECEKRGLNQFYRVKCGCLDAFFECIDGVSESRRAYLELACGC